MKMNNITLIGMPGAGKSTLGVVLAKILGYEFLDSDLLIQKEEKRRLYQIIDEEGEEGFKAIENRVNASFSLFHLDEAFVLREATEQDVLTLLHPY